VLLFLQRNSKPLLSWAVLSALFVYFLSIHPRGLSIDVLTSWSNQGTALALLAIGQTIVVMSRGIDLSIGPVMALSNCVASSLVSGAPHEVAFGIAAVVLTGVLCGFLNGLIVVIGRIQAIIATLATGAIFTGLALLVRPIPGGQIDPVLADAMTWTVYDVLPVSAIIMACGVAIWYLIRKTPIGRTIVASGSAERAAFASGLPVRKAQVLAYVLSGLFAALGGLFISFQTLSGDPSIGLSYTLNSIAAVVIGGTALSGGIGTIIGSVAGALILRTIGSLVFFNDIDPMAQPFFEGMVLLVAVSIGSLRLFGIKNRLEIFR
jgi:ribose transport system permease protein